jgi:AcrR family transcriptional regulator
MTTETGTTDGGGRPKKGRASRETILLAAARLATTKGLEGLSIGDLAAAVGMSKSGLFAHFRSKEELELATIDTAAGIFEREVFRPADAAPAGVGRLWALVDAYLAHLGGKTFPGGCFFAALAAELDTRPGPARDRVAAVVGRWFAAIRQCVTDAQAAGELDPAAEVDQAVFEVEAMLMAANFLFVMTGDAAPLGQARAGVRNVLARLAPPPPARPGRRPRKTP